MIVWTIQPLRLYEKLLGQGVLCCGQQSEGLCGPYAQEISASNWLAGQMKLRVGAPPPGVQYPFWGWALIDGLSKKPDLRRKEFNNYVGENVVLELEIPDNGLLLFDEVNWHYVLNGWYLNDSSDEEDEWDEGDACLDSLSPDIKDSIKRKSWEKIFNKDYPDNEWVFVQATFWELCLEQVKSVQRFSGRGKAN